MTPAAGAAGAAGHDPARTVVIAGAGPTGLMLAVELGLAGLHAVVIEPREGTVTSSPGMALHGRTLQVFEERGLADALREQGMAAWPLTPFAFLWLDLGTVGPEEHTYGIAQWRTEGVLEQRAVELGADLRRGQRVIGWTQDEDGVTVRVRAESPGAQSAEYYEIPAAYLVGCDGRGSTVRRLAGIEPPEHEPSRYYGVLGDIEIAEGATPDFDGGLHPGGVIGAIPLGPGVVRLMTIEFGAVHGVDPHAPVTVAELRASIGRIVGKEPDVDRAVFLARFGSPSAVVDRYRDGRVLLAGDAAHVLFVSGTQGLNAGIQDAVNLGWKLAAEIGGRAPAGLLDTYEEERRTAAVRMVMHARAQLALMQQLRTVGPLRELFSELLRYEEVNRHLLTMTAEAHYPLPGDGVPSHPLLGRHLPDVPLTTAGGEETRTARLLGRGRGLLLLSSGPGAREAGPRPGDGWADRVDVVVARPRAELDAEALLVRPDGQVAYAGPAGDGALRTALLTWFGEPAA